MKNNAMKMWISCALVAFSTSATGAQPDCALPGETWAQVKPDKVTVYFPLPFQNHAEPTRPVLGFYSWMFTVEEGDNGFSVVLTADTAMRTNNLSAIVAQSTLRLCKDVTPTVLRSCKLPVKAKATAQNGYLDIVISDKALMAKLLPDHPTQYWRYVYMPNGFYRVDRKRFEYYDRTRRYHGCG